MLVPVSVWLFDERNACGIACKFIIIGDVMLHHQATKPHGDDRLPEAQVIDVSADVKSAFCFYPDKAGCND